MADKVSYTMEKDSDKKNVKKYATEKDGKAISFYVPNADAETLGDPDKIKITVTAA